MLSARVSRRALDDALAATLPFSPPKDPIYHRIVLESDGQVLRVTGFRDHALLEATIPLVEPGEAGKVGLYSAAARSLRGDMRLTKKQEDRGVIITDRGVTGYVEVRLRGETSEADTILPVETSPALIPDFDKLFASHEDGVPHATGEFGINAASLGLFAPMQWQSQVRLTHSPKPMGPILVSQADPEHHTVLSNPVKYRGLIMPVRLS